MEPGAQGGKRADVLGEEERKGDSCTRERAPGTRTQQSDVWPGVQRNNLRVRQEAREACRE